MEQFSSDVVRDGRWDGAAPSLSDVVLGLKKSPAGLGEGVKRFLLAHFRSERAGGGAGELDSTLSSRFSEAVNQTVAEWMMSGMESALWSTVEEIRRAIRDVMRMRGTAPAALEPLDLYAERFRAVADLVEAHLQPGSVSSIVARYSSPRLLKRSRVLKLVLGSSQGAVRPQALIAAKIYDRTPSADDALNSLADDGLLVAEGVYGGAYRLTFLGRRVALALQEKDRAEGGARDAAPAESGGRRDSAPSPTTHRSRSDGDRRHTQDGVPMIGRIAEEEFGRHQPGVRPRRTDYRDMRRRISSNGTPPGMVSPWNDPEGEESVAAAPTMISDGDGI